MMKKTRRFQVCNVLEMETESSHYVLHQSNLSSFRKNANIYIYIKSEQLRDRRSLIAEF